MSHGRRQSRISMGAMPPMDWYFVDKQGGQHGPAPASEIKKLWDEKKIDDNCLVWNETMSGWQEIKSQADLKRFLSPPKLAAAPAVPAVPAAAAAPKPAAPAGGGGFLAELGAVRLKKSSTSEESAPGAAAPQASPNAAAEARKRADAEKAQKDKEEKERIEKEKSAKRQEAEAKRREVESKRQAEKSIWVELFTTDGLPYYHNKMTNETTWDKPDALKSPEELDKAGEWFWMPHEDEAFMPARKIQAYFDGRLEMETEHGDKHVVTPNPKQPLEPLQWSQLHRLQRDLVMLDVMNVPLILHNLRKRFQENEIYTNVGDILISVNPYKRLPLYTPSVIDEYRHRGSKILPPHVFTIADDAYNALIETSKPQSIVISGESGAGKTECTKQCLQYFAEVAGSDSNVEQKILLANPILEAFGNAKTVRNNNSSRFGKYIEIFFDNRNSICGAQTTNYLLEKSRIVHQAKGERCFHIFYQLLSGASAQQRSELALPALETCQYLIQGGDTKIPGVSDEQAFQETEEAMKLLQFTDAERSAIFRTTAAVLHLGNVTFRNVGEKLCEVENKEALSTTAKLLEVTDKQLFEGVTTRVVRVPGQADITVTLGKGEAYGIRDAFAKFIYAALFDWLVDKINKQIGTGKSIKGRTIGILDIFGFEIFEVNSFEQLCINFANEKLQQHFNAHTFKMEEAIYRQEKIVFTPVPYIDNQGVLDLIELKPHGIVPMLDEELRMPKGADKSFLTKLIQQHNKKTKEFDTVLAHADQFLVKHYAGDVSYDVNGFLLKNKDKMNEETVTLVQLSRFQFLKDLFKDNDVSKDRKTSLGTKFSNQLNDLMTTLNSSEPHYIRCVKPNPNKAPLEFIGKLVLEQLRYSGVFEAVQIRKSGYPFRLSHDDFWKRYRCIAPKRAWPKQPLESCKLLIPELKQDLSQVQIGVTRVLYRAAQHRDMELQRNLAVEATVIFLQRVIRGWRARKLYHRLKKLKPQLVAAMKQRSLELLEKALEQAATVRFEIYEVGLAKRLKFVLTEEKRIATLLTDLIKKDPEVVFEELSKAIAAADEIELHSDLADRARARLGQVKDMRKARKDLKDGVVEADEEKLKWAVAKAKELSVNAPADIKAAEQMLERISREKVVLNKLQHAIDHNGWLKQGDAIDWRALDAALSEALSFDMKTPAGVKAVKLGQVLSGIRKTLAVSLGTKEKALWQATEAACMAASEAEASHPEVAACREEVSHQAAVDEVADRLDKGIAQLDQDILTYALQQATQLAMSHELYPVVPVAQQYLERIVQCRQQMKLATEVVEQTELIYAIELADSFGYNTLEVQTCRALRDTVLQINTEAAYVLEVLVEDMLRDVMARAEAIRLTTPDIEKIRTLLLETPEEKFVQLQLKAAVKCGDPSRVTQITIRLKDIFFAKNGHMFGWENFPLLLPCTSWADLKFLSFSRDELAASMRKWTNQPIHAPLTDMQEDSNKAKMAVKMFKNLMGFMGDRQYSDPQILLSELLTNALEQPYLRDEIYCQIIKQLEGNPDTESRRKGWLAMSACLETFPPKEFENYLEMYLRTNAPDKEKYVGLLHSVVYGGERKTAPSEHELQQILNGYTLRQITFASGKSYVAPQAQLQASGRQIGPIVEEPAAPAPSPTPAPAPAHQQYLYPEAAYSADFTRDASPSEPPPPPSLPPPPSAPTPAPANLPPAPLSPRGPRKAPMPPGAPPAPRHNEFELDARYAAAQHGPRVSVAAAPPRMPQAPRPAGPPRGPAAESHRRLSSLVNSVELPPAPVPPTPAPAAPAAPAQPPRPINPPPASPRAPPAAGGPVSARPVMPARPMVAAAPGFKPPAPSGAPPGFKPPAPAGAPPGPAPGFKPPAPAGPPPAGPAPVPHRPAPAPPAPPPPKPVSLWQTAKHPETGEVYYYNTQTMEVTWDKPADLLG